LSIGARPTNSKPAVVLNPNFVGEKGEGQDPKKNAGPWAKTGQQKRKKVQPMGGKLGVFLDGETQRHPETERGGGGSSWRKGKLVGILSAGTGRLSVVSMIRKGTEKRGRDKRMCLYDPSRGGD